MHVNVEYDILAVFQLLLYLALQGAIIAVSIYLFVFHEFVIGNLLTEFFRGDEARGIWPDGLSSSQHIALMMIIAATTVLLVSVKKAGQPA